MKLTIVRKGMLLVLAPLCFQLAFIALTAVIQREHSKAQALATHSSEVASQADDVLRTLIDSETGMRGYLLTENHVFTEPSELALRVAPVALEKLSKLVSDNPEQLARASQIKADADAVLNGHSKVIKQVEDGEAAEALEWVKTQQGKRNMDRARRDVAALLTAEEQLRIVRDADLEATRWRLNTLLVLGCALAIGVTATLGYLFSHGVSRRLSTLTENSRRLAQNQPLAAPVKGSDEVAYLDRVFHAMADSLARSAEKERDYTKELEQRVAERTADMRRINHDLMQQNRENEMFVYSVSHDLRSPLVNLQGFSNELKLTGKEVRELVTSAGLPGDVQKRASMLIDEDMLRSISFIQSAVMRLSGIIDALLRLSRAGRVEYQPQRVDIQAMVNRIVEASSGTIFDRGAAIKVQPMPDAWGDATAVEQVFANLIGNALNYLDSKRPGVVEIGALTKDGQFVTDEANGGPIYYVKDNGLGIPTEYAAKVFEAFKRLHPEVAKGEGMGLAMVRRIVDRHNGRIWLESTEGVGTTFFVALPAHGDQAKLSKYTDERSQHGAHAVGHSAG